MFYGREMGEMTEANELSDTGNPEAGDAPKRRGIHPVLKVLLVILLLAATSCGGCFVAGYQAQAEGRIYAKTALPAIARSWSIDALVERGSPDLLSNPREKLVDLFTWLSARLGPLKDEPKFQDGGWRNFLGTKGFVVTAVYFADCEFEKGSGRVTLTLVRTDGVWRINGFHVNSEALMK